MSNSLYWTPPPSTIKEHSLDLKYEIGKYLDPDYNGGSDSWTVGSELIPFLKGIECCAEVTNKTKSAKELIAAIEKYGEVVLTIHG